jgi:antirestriction protein ArdC
MKVNEVITNKFLEAIKSSGTLPWQKPWRTISVRNAVTGRAYNGVNQLLLSLIGKDDHYLTFNQAKQHGAFVKAGTGLPICFFRFNDKKDKNGNVIRNANGKAETYPSLRYYTVFPLSETTGGEALKAKAAARKKAIDFAPIEACENIVKASGFSIFHKGDRAAYSPALHTIMMPAPETFKSVEHYYVTLFHEIGHAMAKECGEDITNGFGSDPYAREELVAELFANLCISFVGIENQDLFDNSTAYFQNWLDRLKKDASLLISASSKASKRFITLANRAGFSLDEDPEVEEMEAVA